MSEKKDDGGQAFPCLECGGSGLDLTDGGMTLRQYAAIKLRVPSSGTDWLDEMIRTSQRDEIAAKAMQAYSSSPEWRSGMPQDGTAKAAYKMADAMLKESGK